MSPDTNAGEPQDVTDSDPNSGADGLAGGMGVSSEREGALPRSSDTGTHGAGDDAPAAPRDARDQADDVDPDDPPEQTPDPRRGPEDNPDPPPQPEPSRGANNPLGPGPGDEHRDRSGSD